MSVNLTPGGICTTCPEQRSVWRCTAWGSQHLKGRKIICILSRYCVSSRKWYFKQQLMESECLSYQDYEVYYPQCLALQGTSRIAWSWPQRCFQIRWCDRWEIWLQTFPALGLLLHISLGLLLLALWLCRLPSTTPVTPILPRTRRWGFPVSKQS